MSKEDCACFPGTCRGGEVIDGKTASGQCCKRAGADLYQVPTHILKAVEQVESYFLARGVLSWALGGIQSRYRGAPPPADARIVDATHHDLYRALLAKDDPPEGLARAVAATVQHLGFCCLGERIVRLKLPNGRTIRVTLE